MKKILLLAILALPLASGTAMAVDVIGLNDVIQTLENPFKADAVARRGTARSAITDFEADFFQESRLVSLNREQRGRGRVWVKFDRQSAQRVPLTMFRWEYEQPTQQEIVSNGQKMWVYLPENNQVILSDVEFSSQTRPDDPMTFLTGLGNLSRDFLITWATPNTDVEGNYVLELRPRRVSQMIQRLVIVVDRDAVLELTRNGSVGDFFPILSSTVYDPNGNATLIEFHDVRVNRGLSDNFFDFIMPAGVDVVRPGEAQMGF
nr:outer membrane lipoprotein carrier protein LolA [Desulfuromonadales bacterium]